MLPALLMARPAEPVPVCEMVVVQENSGAGPNYRIKLCGNRELDVSALVVDGEAFPERSTTARVIVFWSQGSDAGDP